MEDEVRLVMTILDKRISSKINCGNGNFLEEVECLFTSILRMDHKYCWHNVIEIMRIKDDKKMFLRG